MKFDWDFKKDCRSISTFKIEGNKHTACACALKTIYKLEKVVEAARELIRGNDLLDQESVLMKDVDHIRTRLEDLDGEK